MKKKYVIAIIIIALLLAAVICGIRFGKQSKQEDKESKVTTEETGSLPLVNVYYGEEKIATANGYTTVMEGQYLRDNLIPVGGDRNLPVKITTNGNTVQAIRYEVRSTDDNRLIDNGQIEEWSQKKGTLSFDMTVSAIVENKTEYQLIFIVSTDKFENIYYYNRIMVMNEDFVSEQIKFAKQFSLATLGENDEVSLAVYIEPDVELANDNLGKISLKSNYSLLTWSELRPKRQDGMTISAKEFCIKDNGQAGTYTIEYQVKATNAEKVDETYNVAETIVVWTFNERQYVLAYNREVNQQWEATTQNVGNSFIDLGIQNTEDIEVVESESKQFIAYAINGDVYSMDLSNKQVTQLFALGANSAGELRNTKAKVVRIDDEGNADFLVYGYSNATEHIGRNGISVIHYSHADKESNEIIFIPYSQPAEMIEKEVNKICYVNDGAIYFMVDKDLHYVNFATKEHGTVISGLTDDSYAINQNRTAIAYNTNMQSFNSDEIAIIDFRTGTEKRITAENGEKLTVLGYTGGNLVYGITEAKNVAKNKLRINTLRILDEEFNEITTYSKENIIITGVEISDALINIKRMKKGKSTSDDQLIDNTVKAEKAIKVSYYADTLKLHELAIAYTNALSGKDEVKTEDVAKVTYNADSEMQTTITPGTENKFYVYAAGRLQDVCDNLSDAQTAGKTLDGLVLDTNGQKIWTFEENYND